MDGGATASFAPAKPFARIETNQVVLDDGQVLKVTKFVQMESPIRFAGQSPHMNIVKFEKSDFAWGFIEMPDSTLRIMQTSLKKLGTSFIVSQNKDRQPDPLASAAPRYQLPPMTVGTQCAQNEPKQAYYVDCWPDSVVLMPGSLKVTWAELQQPTNAVAKFLDDIQQHNRTTYAVVIARPDSVKLFRQVRKLIGERSIDCGYDSLAANVPLELFNTPANPMPARSMAHPGNQAPVFFECRAEQVFYIDKVDLDGKVEKLLTSLSPQMRSGDPNSFVRAVSSNEVSNAYYKVMPSYLLAMMLALEPKPGVRGDDRDSIQKSSIPFQISFNIFRQARELAGQLGFETQFEVLDKDEPIKFGTGGTPVPTF